jgi:hypothetical protein
MAHVGDVVFALERFEWSAEDRLEVVGRWDGLQGRRMGRPALTVVESSGRRRRLHALPGGQLSGEQPWRASFAWDGNGATVERAELELGRRLVVELPPPRRPRRRAGQTASLPTPAVAALEAELAGAREELERLAGELDEAIRERDALAAAALAGEEQAEAARGERERAADLAARLEAEVVAREATERGLREERVAGERLRKELGAAEHLAATATARLPVSRSPRGRGRGHGHGGGAHRVASHERTVMELWGTRVAAVVLAGLLLLALALVLGVVF